MSAWAVEAAREPRGLRPFALAAAMLFLGVVLAFGAWRFVSPPDGASSLSAVRLAPASDFAPGSVTGYRITAEGGVEPLPDQQSYYDARTGTMRGRVSGTGVFHVVHLPSGEFRVFSGRSTHLGGVVVWDTSGEIWSNSDYVGVFVEPAHGEQWTVDGTVFYGPAPRDLDRYESYIDDSGVLVIDLSEVQLGEYRGGMRRPDSFPPIYDVNDPAWPTSGWPNVAVN